MDEFLCSDVPSGKDGSLYVCDVSRNPKLVHLELLEAITNDFSEHSEIGRGAFGVVYKGVYDAETIAVKKLSLVDDTSFHQEYQSLMKIMHQHVVRLVGYCSEIITDSSCGRGKLYRIIKPNCECLHQFRKNTVHLDMKCSNIPLDENLEPRIYDLDVSTPFDQNHICVPEILSQMDPNGIFGSRATLLQVMVMLVTLAYTVRSAVGVAKGQIIKCLLTLAYIGLHWLTLFVLLVVVMLVTLAYTVCSAVGVAKAQIIKWNSSVWCLLVKMLLFRKEIKVPVSRRSLNRKTQYLKRNGTFRRCSFLFIPTEAPTKKKTVANGNGEGADNGSSVEVSFCQANHGLSASAETPISQSERSSISRSDEPATVDNSSLTPSSTLESIWYIASAAAHHMTGVLDLLTNYTPMSGELVVHTPNMGRMQVLGSGSVNTANITLQDVWYVPGLDVNLVSTNQLTKLGHTVSLGPYGCRINKDSEDGALMGSAHFTDDYLFAVDFLNAQPTN